MSNIVRRVAKQGAVAALGNRVTARLRSQWNGRRGRVTILNLHRTCVNDGSAYQPLSPKLFRALLAFVVDTYEVLDFRALGQSRPESERRPLAVLSFDDGYKDFIDVAYPLLSEFGLRVNLNVIPECVESGQPPLNVALQDVIGKAPEVQVRNLLEVVSGRRHLDASEPMNRFSLGHGVSNFVKSQPHAEQVALRDTIESAFPGLLAKWSTRMLDVDDVKFLSESHEIGIHSYSHSTMSIQSEDFFYDDVRRCCEWSRSILGQDPLIYAFPNGAYQRWQINALIDAGFHDILLVNEDYSTAGSNAHPRFTFHADSASEVRFRATGALRA